MTLNRGYQDCSDSTWRCQTQRTLMGLVLGLAALLLCVCPAQAVTWLQRGDEAPAFELPNLDGKPVSLAQYKGRTVILLFGELYHGKSLSALRDVSEVLRDGRLRALDVAVLMVVTQDRPAADLKEVASKEQVRATILRDVDRKVYEAYRVSVMPSTVVVDDRGLVVHAIGAHTGGFRDRLTDALLLTGRWLTGEQFDREQRPDGSSGPADEKTLRAQRQTRLATLLVQRGLDQMAEQKFEEILREKPGYIPAHLGLGQLHLRRGRLVEAEEQFRLILDLDAASAEATWGLAIIQIERGGDEIIAAERLVRNLLAAKPRHPRSHYLLGLIHQMREEHELSAASFRKAVELLVEQIDE